MIVLGPINRFLLSLLKVPMLAHIALESLTCLLLKSRLFTKHPDPPFIKMPRPGKVLVLIQTTKLIRKARIIKLKVVKWVLFSVSPVQPKRMHDQITLTKITFS